MTEELLGKDKVAGFAVRVNALGYLTTVAQTEGGFSAGLLACLRARAAELVIEILNLSPLAPSTQPQHPVTQGCTNNSSRQEQVTPPQNNREVPSGFDRVKRNPNAKPANFMIPYELLCEDLARGELSSDQLAKKYDCCPGQVHKTKIASRYMSHGPRNRIRAWLDRHPGSDLHAYERKSHGRV